MSGITTRKSYTKIKNFTEKDQVRVKYSNIGKDKKLMLSVYIGNDVYNELTNGQTFKRLKVEYIPNDMVIITPTDDEKEGVVHRYNGKGMFKTTCVRLSLSSYKTLKLRKKDFNNRVVSYNIWLDKAHIYGCNKLKVDLIGDKRKLKLINKLLLPDYTKPHIEVPIDDMPLKEFMSIRLNEDIKPIDISPTGLITPDYQDMPSREYIDGPTPMYVSHDFLNDARDSIENRLLGMEERFEIRIMEFEDYFIKKLDRLDNKIMDNFKINKLEEDVKAIENLLKEFMEQPLRPLKADKGNGEMKTRFSNLEKAIVELDIKNSDIKSKLSIILNLLSSKKPAENKSLFERIFGKD